MNIEKYLISYFKDNFDIEVTGNTHLLEEGIIDSMGVVGLVTFISKECGIEFDMEDMTAENFDTVFSITKLILTKKEGA